MSNRKMIIENGFYKGAELEIKPAKPQTKEKSFFICDNMLPIALGALDLNASETRIYLYMMSLANGSKYGTCFPSINILTARLNISASQVKRSRKRLEELGLIKVVTEGGRTYGSRLANVYKVYYPVINLNTIEELEPEDYEEI